MARAKLPLQFSTYLDLVRFTAAAMVVLYHLRTLGAGPPAFLRVFPGVGHEFVVVFFVLSGYVIAATVDRKPGTLGDYTLDRMARVYSVAIPTMVVSTAVAVFLKLGTTAEAFGGLAANLAFVGQSWSANVTPPTNPAFWSLCYEVMYYALFGCAVYLRGWSRIAACAAVALIAGPKVLLLLPCWLAGVAAYRFRDRFVLNQSGAILLGVALPCAAFAAMTLLKLGAKAEALLITGFDLGFSRHFAKDFITAALVGLHLYAMRWVELRWSEGLRRAIVAGASFTFTLYLIHYPIIEIMRRASFSRTAVGLALTLLLIALATYAVGSITESRRHALRALMARLAPGRSVTST